LTVEAEFSKELETSKANLHEAEVQIETLKALLHAAEVQIYDNEAAKCILAGELSAVKSELAHMESPAVLATASIAASKMQELRTELQAQKEEIEHLKQEGEAAAERAVERAQKDSADAALKLQQAQLQELLTELQAQKASQAEEIEHLKQDGEAAAQRAMERAAREAEWQGDRLRMKVAHAEELEHARKERVEAEEKSRAEFMCAQENQARLVAELQKVEEDLVNSKMCNRILRTRTMEAAATEFSAHVDAPDDEGLTLGIEAEEDAKARGDVTAHMQDLLLRAGARQAFRIGRMHLPKDFSDAMPACAKVAVKNDGMTKWPDTVVLAKIEGDSFGLPTKALSALEPNEVEEVTLELEVNASNEPLSARARPRHSMPKTHRLEPGEVRSDARSVWAISDAASGARLGPLLIFEVSWDLE
jgi:hypothetical protein